MGDDNDSSTGNSWCLVDRARLAGTWSRSIEARRLKVEMRGDGECGGCNT
jgi:hypothetical protein